MCRIELDWETSVNIVCPVSANYSVGNMASAVGIKFKREKFSLQYGRSRCEGDEKIVN